MILDLGLHYQDHLVLQTARPGTLRHRDDLGLFLTLSHNGLWLLIIYQSFLLKNLTSFDGQLHVLAEISRYGFTELEHLVALRTAAEVEETESYGEKTA